MPSPTVTMSPASTRPRLAIAFFSGPGWASLYALPSSRPHCFAFATNVGASGGLCVVVRMSCVTAMASFLACAFGSPEPPELQPAATRTASTVRIAATTVLTPFFTVLNWMTAGENSLLSIAASPTLVVIARTRSLRRSRCGCSPSPRRSPCSHGWQCRRAPGTTGCPNVLPCYQTVSARAWGERGSGTYTYIRYGESVKTVQSLLGHSSAAITLNVYAHLWPDVDDRARQAVEAAFPEVPGMCLATVRE